MKTTILTVTLVLIMCGALNGMDHRKRYTAHRVLEEKKSKSAAVTRDPESGVVSPFTLGAGTSSATPETTLQRSNATWFIMEPGAGAGSSASAPSALTGLEIMQRGGDSTTESLNALSINTSHDSPMDTSDEKGLKTPPTVRLEGEAEIVRASSGPQLSHSAAQQFVGLVHHAQAVTALVSSGVGAGQAGHSASSSSTSSSSLSR